jgi:hypothetical protein
LSLPILKVSPVTFLCVLVQSLLVRSISQVIDCNGAVCH